MGDRMLGWLLYNRQGQSVVGVGCLCVLQLEVLVMSNGADVWITVTDVELQPPCRWRSLLPTSNIGVDLLSTVLVGQSYELQKH